jgi:dihydrofolate reductase
MNVTLYMAMSTDGFVAGPEGETPWSDEEWEAFTEVVQAHGNIIVGHRTYTIMKNKELSRIGKPFVVVVAKQPIDDQSCHNAASPRAALALLQQHGFSSALLAGGPTLNAAFRSQGLLDAIIIDVEPVLLHAGLKLFGHDDVMPDMQLVEKRTISSRLTQKIYRKI